MSLQKINPRTIILLIIMITVAALRLVTHFTDHSDSSLNFTPIGAMAIFGAAYFKGRLKPFFFPLFTLFISDVILSCTIYSSFREGILYTGWYWTYGAFALMTLASKTIIKNINIKTVVLTMFCTTLIHWLVSDIGGCLSVSSTAGFFSNYGQRLVTAIPFELKLFAGTAIYGSLMFGTFELIQKRLPAIQLK
jgi:hypothetical protein